MDLSVNEPFVDIGQWVIVHITSSGGAGDGWGLTGHTDWTEADSVGCWCGVVDRETVRTGVGSTICVCGCDRTDHCIAINGIGKDKGISGGLGAAINRPHIGQCGAAPIGI